jgi:Uncharacterized protein involved in exopolysaccharide biosynthesis
VIEQTEIQSPVTRLRPFEPPPEQPIDVPRYANALRRSRVLIAGIVLGITALVLVLSLALPKTYTAHATILYDNSAIARPTRNASWQRSGSSW